MRVPTLVVGAIIVGAAVVVVVAGDPGAVAASSGGSAELVADGIATDLSVDVGSGARARRATVVDRRPRPQSDYRRPVDRRVRDPFRMQNGPYGAGNRGLEYETVLGDAVSASASGEVVFAGVVANRASVTLRHADGRRTAVTGLARISVAEGDVVLQGDLLGLAAPKMHFSIREGSTYVDPAGFLVDGGVPERRAVLVPLAP